MYAAVLQALIIVPERERVQCVFRLNSMRRGLIQKNGSACIMQHVSCTGICMHAERCEHGREHDREICYSREHASRLEDRNCLACVKHCRAIHCSVWVGFLGFKG